MSINIIEGGICAAKGFKANGIHCGVRKNRLKRDIALLLGRTYPRNEEAY